MTSSSKFLYENNFIVFIEQRQAQIKASLKYMGGCFRGEAAARWEKPFYRPQILSDDILRFGVGGR